MKLYEAQFFYIYLIMWLEKFEKKKTAAELWKKPEDTYLNTTIPNKCIS